MSQEYTEDKNVTLKPLSGSRRLAEVLLLVTGAFSIYLLVALFSFDPADPSWSQTAWHEPINNYAGSLGAWIADTLFFTFGILAYPIPFILFLFVWFVFRQCHREEYTDFFMVALRVIGVAALLSSSCGLASFNADDLYYFSSGGVIGSLLNSAITPWLNGLGATLVLMAIWAAGFTLFTGWSWLSIAEKIGAVVLNTLAFITHPGGRQQVIPVDESMSETPDASLEKVAEWEKTVAEDPLFSSLNVQDEEDAVLLRQTDTEDSESERQLAATEDELPVFKAQPEEEELQPSQTQVEPHGDVSLQNKWRPVYFGQTAVEEPGTPPLGQLSDVLHESVSSQEQSQLETEGLPIINPGMPETETNRFAAQPRHEALTISATEFAGMSANPFLPVEEEGFTNLQVKKGIGPELPRPNPVRIPTRRELASYGIRIPARPSEENTTQKSQNISSTEHLPTQDLGSQVSEWSQISATQPAQEDNTTYAGTFYSTPDATAESADAEELSHFHFTAVSEEGLSQEEQEALQASRLREEFMAQQKARYATTDEEELQTLELEASDDEEWQEERLRQEFSAQLASRYQNEEQSALDMPSRTSSSPLDTSSHLTVGESEVRGRHEPTWNFEPVTEHEGETHAQMPPFTPLTKVEELSAVEEEEAAPSIQDALIHPFLMRNDQPLPKPTTPLPTLDLLTQPPATETPIDMFELQDMARLIEDRLADYRVKAEVVGICPGPVVTCFELDLAPGVKAARISNLSRDLARSLSTVAVRIVEVIPGKSVVGLELPNKHRQTVHLREVLDCPRFRESHSPLTVVLGKDISGQPVIADLAKMPHLLVAGTTGSGKSVGVNAMIISILYKSKPDEVKFIMIDPKMLELSVYEGIPHLLTEVVTDMKDAANALRWCVNEMERRYKLMSALGVRNIAGYNERVAQAEAMGRPIPDPFWKPTDSMDLSPPVLEKLPYIVVMVDEFADLIMAVGKKVEELIARLAQKARAAGIHLVLATQRPSVDVITGLIKANIPTRIAFTVSSKIDSRTILDQGGAESLLGMGDMLYLPPNSSVPVRVHGAFVRDQEVHAVVQDWKARGRPQYVDSILAASDEGEGSSLGFERDEDLDPLFDQAVAFVIEKRRASISGVQRQFRIGYNRAARLIDQMEAESIVSPPGHNGNREVLAPPPHEY